MTDAAFIPLLADGTSLPGFDVAMSGADLLAESGLRTAVILSLFSDRRAAPDDVLPDGSSDRRGFWGDALADIEGDQIGSRLWLLSREKQTADVLARAKEYAEESLQWLIDDGVAKSVDVVAAWVKTGMLGLHIVITRPDNTSATYRFEQAWEASVHAI